MRKMIDFRKTAFFVVLGIFSVLFFSCDTWLSGKNFFGTVAEEVKYANAKEISVYVRYAARDMGDTSPNGRVTEKVDIPFDVTAVDDPAYSFYMWAAFSSDDYPTSTQHSDILMLNSIDEFNEAYADTLLPETEVWFENPRSAATKAKVLTERNDVFIMPICVKRPFLNQTIPAANETGVVKNTALTIVFSRSMDPSYLLQPVVDADGNPVVDEDGNPTYKYNKEYIEILEKRGQGEGVSYASLEEYFETGKATLSKSGRTLTIRQRTDPVLPTGKTVLVKIAKKVSDVLGVEMETNKEFSFLVGTTTDTGAPVINDIEVGYKTLMPTTSDNTQTGIWKKNRALDKLNVWTSIGDTAVLNGSQIGDATVFEVLYRFDNIGGYMNKSYAAGTYAFDPSNMIIPGTSNANGSGYGFSVPIDTLSDGLHSITLYATDIYANSGNNVTNGTKTVYFVKDSTSPSTDKAALISTACDDAPNGWYNATSLGNIMISGTDDIIDSPSGSGDGNLRSPKVWWNFATDGTAEPDADGSGWTEVSVVPKSLKDDLGITLNASSADPTTGLLPMYVSFKDDLGNASPYTQISSLKYDNDKPSVGTMEWQDSTGTKILPLSHQALLDTQVLCIPFTESLSGVKKVQIKVTKDDGSDFDTAVNPLSNAGLSIAYKAEGSSTSTALVKNTDYTFTFNPSTGIAQITFADDADHFGKKSGALLVSNLLTSTEQTSVIHVKMEDSAINMSAEKTIEIHCDTIDPEITKVEFKDTSDEEQVVGAQYYGGTTVKYYLKKGTFTGWGNNATKIPLKIEINEPASGVQKIQLTGDIKISSSTEVYVGSTKMTSSDVSISTSDQTITFIDGENPFVKSSGATGTVSVYLTNLYEDGKNDNVLKTPKIKLTDFAANTGSESNTFTCGTASGIGGVYADSNIGGLGGADKVKLSDTGYVDASRATADSVKGYDGFTNSKYLDMSVMDTSDGWDASGGIGSGIKEVHIKSGAKFSSDTKVYVKAKTPSTSTPVRLTAGTGFTLVDDTTISFARTFVDANYEIIFKDVELTGTLTNNTNYTVYIYVTDAAGWSSQEYYPDEFYHSIKYLSGEITSGAPMVGTGLSYAWPYEAGAEGLVVNASEKNVDNNTVYYFFENSKDNTSNASLPIKYSLGGNYSYAYRIYKYSGDDAFEKTAAEIVAASNTESTASGTNGYRSLSDGTSYSYNSPGTANTVSSGTKKKWSVVFVDKAGNLSKVHSFCIVKDTEGPSYKMGTGDTAADYFPFEYRDKSGSAGEEYNIISRKDSATKYTNIYRTWQNSSSWTANVEISVDLSAYSDLVTSTSGTGIEWYAFDDHYVTPSGSYDSPTWGGWTRIPENKVLKMHAPTTRDSVATGYDAAYCDGTGMHLWLKDYCGNISRVKIMKPEHAANGGYETVTEFWELDGDADHGSWWHFADNSNEALEGKLKESNSVIYFNDNAYFALNASDCHSFFPQATGSNNNASDTSAGDYTTMPKDELDNPMYSRRVRFMWSDTYGKTYTKAEVDQMGSGGTSESLAEGYTPWYYSVATSQYSGSGEPVQKMRAEYPHLTTPRYLYVAIEDGVGNYWSSAMWGYSYKWVYDNTPPIVSLGTDSSVSASGPNAVLGPITDDNKYGFLPKNATKNNRVHINGNDVYYRGGLNFGLSVSDANVSYKWKCDSNPSASPTDSDWSDWLTSSSFTPEMTAQGAVYLHFKDIVGNITSVRLGGENVLWKKDTLNPVWKSIPSTATTNADGKKELFNSDAGYKLTYDINTNVDAANPIGTLTYVVGKGRDLVVKLDDLFEDGGTDSDVKSGLKGLNKNLSNNESRWDDGITRDYTISTNNIPTDDFASINELHVYDNVGNWRRIVVKYKSDASGPSHNDPSFSGTINKYGDTLYYTTQGTNKVTVKVTDIADDIGLYKYCIDHSEHTTPTDSMQNLTASITVDLPTSDGEALYLHLYDKLGSETSIPLTYDGLNKWRSLDTKPAAPVGVTLKEGGSESSAGASTNAKFVFNNEATHEARIIYLTGKIRSDNCLFVYPQKDSTANYIAGFSVSPAGSSLYAAGSPFTYSSLMDGSTINLYTVDYAGNVSENPLEITWEETTSSISSDYEIVVPTGKSINVNSGTNWFSSDVTVKLKDPVFFGTLDSWGIGAADGEGVSSTSLTGEVSIKNISGITSATLLRIWVKDTAGRSASGYFEYPHTAGSKIGPGLDSTKSTWIYDNVAPAKPTATVTADKDYYYDGTTSTLKYQEGYSPTVTVNASSTSTDVKYYTTDSTDADSTKRKTDGEFTVSVPKNASGDITIYAVDYAGNLSPGLTVTYEKAAFAALSPTVTGHYVAKSGTNYFNGDVEVSLGWTGLANVTYWQIGTSSSKGSETYASATSSSAKIKIPQGITASKTLYIYVEYAYETQTYQASEYSNGTYITVKADGIDKWCFDNTPPAAPTIDGIKGTVGDSSDATNVKVSGTTVYYRSDATAITFTASSTGADSYSNGESGTKQDGNFEIMVSGTGNTTAEIYAWDFVGNKSTAYTLTLVPVAAPTVTVTTTTGAGYVDPYVASGTAYYRSGSITVTPAVSGTTAGITYTYHRREGASETALSSGSFTLGNYSTATALVYVVKDELGQSGSANINAADGVNVWCCDNAAPTKPDASARGKTAESDYAASYVKVDGTKVYYGSNVTSVEITLASSDSGSGIKNYGNGTASPTDGVFTVTPTSGQTITYHAYDNLNNESDALTLEFVSVAAPTKPSASITGSIGDASDTAYVKLVDGKYYYRHDLTSINVSLASTAGTGGEIQEYREGTNYVANGIFSIEPSDSEITKTFVAVDKFGQVSEGLTLTFVKVPAPSVTLTAGAKSGVTTIHQCDKEGVTYFADDEIEITPAVTFDPLAATVGTTAYTYKVGSRTASSSVAAFDITDLTSDSKYYVTETGGFGRTFEYALPAVESKTNWAGYTRPTGSCTYTDTVTPMYNDENDVSSGIMGYKHTVVIHFPAANPGVAFKQATVSTHHETKSETNIGWKESTDTITIECEDRSTTEQPDDVDVTVETFFDDEAIVASPATSTSSVSGLLWLHGMTLDDIAADTGADSAKPSASQNIVQYFAGVPSVSTASEVSESKFASPESFAIGKQMTGFNEAEERKVSLGNVTSVVSDGSVHEAVTEKSAEKPLLGDNSWHPSDGTVENERLAFASESVLEKSVKGEEVRELVADTDDAEKDNKPFNPALLAALSAVLGISALIFQKKMRK